MGGYSVYLSLVPKPAFFMSVLDRLFSIQVWCVFYSI